MERSRQPANLVLRTLATSNTLTMSPMPFACAVNSPVTNLTLNLSELNTGRATPRRKLSLSCLDTPNSASHPTPERSFSTESGCFVDTPSPIDSPTFEMCAQKFPSLKKDVQPEGDSKKKTMSFRRINSMPLPMLRMSPTDIESDHLLTNIQSTPLDTLGFGTCAASPAKTMDTSDETVTDISSEMHQSGGSFSSSDDSLKKKVSFYIDECSSQDSGFECDKDSRDAKDLDVRFEFAAPQGIPPSMRRHSKMICEDTCSPFKYSPVKEFSPSKRRNSRTIGSLDFSGEIVLPNDENCQGSPLKMCPLTSVDEGIGESFLDIMDDEMAKQSNIKPSSAMSSLFTAPLINKKQHTSCEDDDTPVTRRVISRRYLQRSQSMNVRSMDERFGIKREKPDECESPMQFTFKRNQPQDESTPRQEQKRMRPLSMESPVKENTRPVLHRCHSESEAMIKSALNRQADEPDLIGDCSKTYCLPTQVGKHRDLKCISSETMSRVIEGEYSDVIEKVYIVDCRYPYEFQGGHIQGADNIYTNEGIINSFLKNPIRPNDSSKRVILVFHCEFSSERGPRLSRFLRSQDRMTNKECYPNLHYPEIYLLEGGYKQFFETEKVNCVPQTYKPMLHPDHNEDLRKFRIKSKSWAGEQKASRTGFRPLKF